MPRPVLYPDRVVALPPRLCAPVADYVAAWSCGGSAQRWDVRFDKRDKATHRFVIADTRGRLDLTVPIAKPDTHRCLWSDIRISGHGAWWDVHRVALESAYGRTPYFEFYIDRFLPMLTVGVTDRYPRLEELALAWDARIRDILGLGAPVSGGREAVIPASEALAPYRQVRRQQLGYIGGLSVLDLIFNLGPEGQLYLNEQAILAL